MCETTDDATTITLYHITYDCPRQYEYLGVGALIGAVFMGFVVFLLT